MKIHSGKTKTLTKDIVKQNSTENIEGNENAEKEILNMSEKEDNKARTKNGYNCRWQHNKTSERLQTVKKVSSGCKCT